MSENYRDRFRRLTGRDMTPKEVEDWNKNKDVSFDMYVKDKEAQKPKAPEAKPLDEFEQARLDQQTRESKRVEAEFQKSKKEEEMQRNIEAAQRDTQRKIAEYASYFQGECAEARKLRTEIAEIDYRYAIGMPTEIQKKRMEMVAKYLSMPYEFSNERATFREVKCYVSESLGLRITSMDGKKWKLEGLTPEDIARFKAPPTPKTDAQGKLIGFNVLVQNKGLYETFQSGVWGLVPIDIKPIGWRPEPKPVVKKAPVKPYNCSDQGLEHRYLDSRCVVCGHIKPKEQ